MTKYLDKKALNRFWINSPLLKMKKSWYNSIASQNHIYTLLKEMKLETGILFDLIFFLKKLDLVIEQIEYHISRCTLLVINKIFNISHLLYFSSIYIYKVAISDCLFLYKSDHNLGTPGPICLRFWLGNSGELRECFKLGFEILSGVGRLKWRKFCFPVKSFKCG